MRSHTTHLYTTGAVLTQRQAVQEWEKREHPPVWRIDLTWYQYRSKGLHEVPLCNQIFFPFATHAVSGEMLFFWSQIRSRRKALFCSDNMGCFSFLTWITLGWPSGLYSSRDIIRFVWKRNKATHVKVKKETNPIIEGIPDILTSQFVYR